MQNPNEIKKVVKEKYAKIAESNQPLSCCNTKSCCGDSNNDYKIMADDYNKINGYFKDADFGLGCGIPTEFANIKTGDVVIDLGCGAGNDAFVAIRLVGEQGKVIGIDMTEEMLEKAKLNLKKLGYENVEFKLGEIESLPIDENIADVVISNCVINLVPDKEKAFSEIYRVLKPNGHFCISDIVIKGELPHELKTSAEMFAGCVSGALQQEEYLKIIRQVGFKNIEIKKSRLIELPDEMLKRYLSQQGMNEYKSKVNGIFSITVVGYKQ